MTQLPEGKSRLDLVRAGIDTGIAKRGRLVLSIDKLIEDPNNERKVFRNMDGLVASVRAVGLVEPITVTSLDKDLYQIITGHRRFRAAKAAGLSTVEVLIRDAEDELSRRRKSIISNVQREDIGPVEMAEALQSLTEEDETIKTQDDLARVIGKDKAWVSAMLRILTIPPELQRRVGTSQLTVSYESMIRIARHENKEQQTHLIEALLSGASHREIRDQIDEFKGKPKKETSTEKPTSPRPKRVYHTNYKASVIVQATGARLTDDQCVMALKQAVQQALEKVVGDA